MDWTEIVFECSQKHKDDATAIISVVSSGIYIEDYENLEQNVMEISNIDLIDDELLARDRENVKIHMYISECENPHEKTEFIKERLSELEIPYAFTIGKIDDEDWANNWKKFYKPFNVGERLIIKPEWENTDVNQGRKVLNIAPGLAFGTGTHESTKMCLELLEQSVKEGDLVLDVGCGSGILSIASLLLGAAHATAIDLDPLAVKVAKENGKLNMFGAEKLTVIHGDLLSNIMDKDVKFNIVAANIIADVVIKLSATIHEYMGENSVFICSGIIEDRKNDVCAALKENGFLIEKICEEKGWTAILAGH